MDISRRRFLTLSTLTSLTLFIPKTFRPSWRQSVSTLFTPIPDYQIALFSPAGEFSCSAYARLTGQSSIDFTTQAGQIQNIRTLAFPPSTLPIQQLCAVQILDKDGATIHSASFKEPFQIPAGVKIQFNPGDIRFPREPL